jgi:methylenetetrahydrofolate dehydrogenase (NAD+)
MDTRLTVAVIVFVAIARAHNDSGFRYELREVDKSDLEAHIIAANKDKDVDGIIVYYPIHKNRQDQYLQQLPSVNKDVEGLHHQYIFNMYQNIRFLDAEQRQKSILVSARRRKGG